LYGEAFRETLYTASLAGIHSSLSYSEYTGQFLQFKCSSYNDAIEEYIGDAFKQMTTYEVPETMFNNIRDLYMRNLKNSLIDEPYRRLTEVRD